MGDKIYIDTELLRQISSQLSQVHHSLSGIQQKLSNSVSEVGRVVSDQVGLINVLSAVQKNTRKDSDYTESLAKAVNNAAARWEEVERRLANQQIQGSEDAPQGTGGVIKGQGKIMWFGKYTGAVMGGAIGAGIGYVVGGLFPMGGQVLGETVGMWAGSTAGAANDPGTGLDYTYKIEDLNLRKWIFPYETGEYSAQEYEAKNGILFAKRSLFNGSLKTRGQTGMDDAQYNGSEGWNQKTGFVSFSSGVGSEFNMIQAEDGFRWENGELTNKGSLFGGAVSGDLGAKLFTRDGFDPQGGGKLKGEVYVLKDEVSGKYGTENHNIYGGIEGTLFGAGAEGKLGIIKDENGKFKGYNFEREAYEAKIEAKVGTEFYGVKVGLSGEAMAGSNISSGFKMGNGAVGGKLGLGPLKGKIDIDFSDFLKKNGIDYVDYIRKQYFNKTT